MAATAPNTPPEFDPNLLRKFSLTAFDVGEDGEEDVELVVKLPDRPSVRKHASLAGLYLLAIMTLDQDGTISRRLDELLEAGPISEVDACNRITLLLASDANTIAA